MTFWRRVAIQTLTGLLFLQLLPEMHWVRELFLLILFSCAVVLIFPLKSDGEA